MPRYKTITAGAATGCLALILTGCGTPEGSGPEAEINTPASSPAPPETATAPTQTETSADAEAEPTSEGSNETAGSEDDTSPGTELQSFNTQQQNSAEWPHAEQSSDVSMYLTEIRVGQHDDFERVVFEHSGTGIPAHWAEYVDEAIAEGSGQEIEVDGEAILEVGVGGVTPDPEDPTAALEVEPWADTNGSFTVAEVLPDAPFESHAQYFIGLSEQQEFHVHTAADPARVIVDILR